MNPEKLCCTQNLTADQTRSISDICRELGGIPASALYPYLFAGGTLKDTGEAAPRRLFQRETFEIRVANAREVSGGEPGQLRGLSHRKPAIIQHTVMIRSRRRLRAEAPHDHDQQ
ncbi:MAG: hypothetical protein OXP66_18855 [Candidatus Tectomicrobia bacterium]|nr:hypothetical protein [Candidatus Tectomicrobia bacterium]